MASISNLPYAEGKKPPFKKGAQSSSISKARCFECNSTDHLVADCPKAIEKEKGALEAKLEAIKKKKRVKVKNANIGREENYEEEKSSRGGTIGKGKGKRVATEVRLLERFISIKEAANFEEWTRKRRNITPGHRVDLSDMEDFFYELFAIWLFPHIVFQYFVLNLVGVGDHIGVGKIFNKHTFKRMGFSRNEEGMLVRGGQDDNDESDEDDDENEGQEAMKMDEEESEEEPEEETLEEK
ncbi:hypothetical protein M9H77_09700 [Catharanthus roseus]|uniref:Uncharacterized protein n=1 Tax=Catharanthus roseus TaxID=4058 RepID=A0ACC0C1I5_CATRO|nr:hypothetical protein M9H77_09700 [Catharanthus roseus]